MNGPYLQKLESPFPKDAKFGWNWPSGSGEEDENVKSLQTDRRTDNTRSEKLRWANNTIDLIQSYNRIFHMFVNFSHFHLLFQNHWPKKTTNNKIKTKHPWVKGIQVFFKWRAPTLFQRDIYNSKSTRPNLEIFSRTIGLISNKGSQVFANKDHSIPKRREQFYHTTIYA